MAMGQRYLIECKMKIKIEEKQKSGGQGRRQLYFPPDFHFSIQRNSMNSLFILCGNRRICAIL